MMLVLETLPQCFAKLRVVQQIADYENEAEQWQQLKLLASQSC